MCSIGILLAIFIPRVPSFGFLGDAPLNATSDGGNPQFSRVPANFSFNALVALQGKSLVVLLQVASNYWIYAVNTNNQIVLPLHFNNIHATIYDTKTSRLVATGDLGKYSVPAKTFAQIKVPVMFSYEAANTSDITCKFYSSLLHEYDLTELYSRD